MGRCSMILTTFSKLATTELNGYNMYYAVQETFSNNYCDEITDRTLRILFPVEIVRSEASCGHP